MEGLILVGAFLALPLIYIGTRPVAKLKVEEPVEIVEEEPAPTASQRSEENIKAAKERQERILQCMTPEERELLNEFISNARENGGKGDLFKAWDILMLGLLCCLFVAMVWIGFTKLDFIYNPKKLSV